MKINVHVREKIIPVECDKGTQRIHWLASVGIARFDDNSGISLGVPRGIQDEVGQLLDLNALVSSLSNEQHVWVLLKDDEPSAMIPKDLCW